MRIETQYKELLKIKREIDNRLVDLDFSKIKELILWLNTSKEYQKLKSKDNQLMILDFYYYMARRKKGNGKNFYAR